MKKIIIDGSEIEVLDFQWITEQYNPFNRIDLGVFNVDYIKVKISRQNCREILNKILLANEYVIEADDKKAKFYLRTDGMKRLFAWYKSDGEEIEIEFIGTCNQVD